MNHHKKIGPKREGPFKIIKVIGPVTYQLRLPKTWKIHNVFHATLLRQYKETEVYGATFNKPPPELIEGEEVYEVENILQHRKRGRGINITSNGKATQFRMPRGNWQRCSPTKAVQRMPPALIKTKTQQKNQQNAAWTKIPVNRK